MTRLSLLDQNKIIPTERIDVTSWLDKLSDSEKEIFKERAAIIEFDGGLEREKAEVEAIKRIIQERVIKSKCDICERVNGCILTREHRLLCEGPKK